MPSSHDVPGLVEPKNLARLVGLTGVGGRPEGEPDEALKMTRKSLGIKAHHEGKDVGGRHAACTRCCLFRKRRKNISSDSDYMPGHLPSSAK